MDAIALTKLAVTRGAILHGSFNNISHKKFFVIIGENEEQFVGFFFINSDIHLSIKNKPAQFEMQMPIRKADYTFLSHNSYIGADKIQTINKNKVVSDLVSKNTQIKGKLIDNDLNMLLDAVRNSKLFSKIEKESFFK
ncbi:MAG: hypothetical protein FWC41_09915 [Firmicutes bacterium]|nr:hypothetical protein [Bacillota bacterium]